MDTLIAIDSWLKIAQWVAAGVGTLAVVGALVVGALSWMLNHPD